MERKIDGVLRVPPLTSFNQTDHTVYYYSEDKLAPEKSELIERRLATKNTGFQNGFAPSGC